ncbi:ROK family transcriptional regulator [Aquabacterium lacunae]|uniref:ROK family transcriptional regulator n=1 Tax=Aquabacterium lacunae TaxID=2528630 RepID=A0A4Q9H4F3_9BURK|nr:ROK family transcriptional regulator [Aquabacterium lacunae]TBO30391.1 ROK family transcriptional regulator [Aquabacterium lacunae]
MPRPAHPASAPLPARGSNQVGVRQYNERVVLQAIRQHGALPKAELARLTHLSAQAVSLIIDRLLAEDLVTKQAPVRGGRVGQPSVPIALNPDGAFAVGIKVGRRSMDALLVDFTGAVRMRHSTPYAWPDPQQLFADVGRDVQRLQAHLSTLGPGLAERLQGVGVAAPFFLGGWQTLLGMPEAQARQWQHLDMAACMQDTTDLPVHFVKDTSAACVAELVAGVGRSVRSFLYVFVDTFIGGGLVLDSRLHAGRHGNGGAVGSLPLHIQPDSAHTTGVPPQLLSVASLQNLEQAFEQAGLDPTAAYDDRALLADWAPHSQAWLAQTARGIAMAANVTASLLDIDGVIVDGSFSRSLHSLLTQQVQQALNQYHWEGIYRPDIIAGTIGSDARALGGALMPLYANFAPDREVFLKLEA